MPSVNPTCHHQSASSATAWEKCQTLHRLAYREGLRVAEDSETLRVGSAWHKVHEVYYAAGNAAFTEDTDSLLDSEDLKNIGLQAVIAHLDKQYAEVPHFSTVKDWALEKQILWTCFQAYLWYYSNDPIEVLASEVPFDLPIHNRSGLPLPMSEVKRVGKIDHIIRWHGMIGSLERKSTTRDIEPGSDYWDMGKKDIQVSMYACALRDTLDASEQAGQDKPWPIGEEESFGNTLYDVWRRPRTKPKMLTQGDTAKFIADGVYFGQKFNVAYTVDVKKVDPDPAVVDVNDELCDVEMGKKGFAIRESVEMYAARLMAEIQETPESFFQRKEIVRTDAELAAFRRQTYNRYLQQKYVEKHEIWTENAKACRDPFNCSYIPICFGPGADAVCDGKTTPTGFKRIFTPLTVDGIEV